MPINSKEIEEERRSWLYVSLALASLYIKINGKSKTTIALKSCLLYMVLLLLAVELSAQRSTLSGIVSDAASGETLVHASLYLRESGKGTITDENGFFVLSGIEEQNSTLLVSYTGFLQKELKLQTGQGQNQFVEVKLFPADVELEEIRVMGSGSGQLGDREVEISMHTLSPKAIQSIPTARNDVFRALRYLPGVEGTEPMSPLVSVRGSDPGENLIMLDGVTIYNPYHFMSSSGIFNMQTVKNTDIMAGGFGAEYGGRNASVINISTRDGHHSELHGEVRPSTAESKVFLEFPLGEKTTMMVASRLNYDIPGNFLMYSNNYFYDANLSLTHRLNAKNRLTLKYFASADRTRLDFNKLYRYMGHTLGMEDVFNDLSLKWVNRWNNQIATLIWKSVPGPKLFLRVQVSGSFHRADNFSEMKLNVENMVYDTSTRFGSSIDDLTGKAQLSYHPFSGNELKTGVEYSAYRFYNASALNNFDYGSAEKTPDLLAFFIEDKITLGALMLRPGVRMSRFVSGDWRYEPRMNAVWQLPGRVKLQAAWGRYYQYIVSMNTQEFEFNQFLDYYYPLMNSTPGYSEHFILGAEKQLGTQHLLSVDLYYKPIHRTYIFDLMQDKHEAFALSDKIVAGEGRSYGMELMWKGQWDRFSGWGSYTLSKSLRSFPHLMNGEWFPYDYDRRHSIKAVMNYEATRRISYSASFIAQSGVPRSVENMLQMYYMYDPLSGQMTYSPQFTVQHKNTTRMPWLLYLDLGLKKQVVSGFGKNLADFFGADESYFVLNVQNVLFFRRNVLYYLTLGDFDRYVPLGDNYLPTVSAGYTIKF